MSDNYSKGIKITEIDTPSIVVDLNIAEENIKKMQSFANDNNVSITRFAASIKLLKLIKDIFNL